MNRSAGSPTAPGGRRRGGWIVLAGLAVVGGGILWFGRGVVWPGGHGDLGGEASGGPAGPIPSQELSDSTMAEVRRFLAGGVGDTLGLGSAEVTSVIRYGVPGLVPSGMVGPAVRFRDGRVTATGRVGVGSFPRLPDLGAVLGMLPDTLPVVVRGELVQPAPDLVAVLVDGIEAMRIPLPQGLIPDVLDGLGRRDRDGLPQNAIEVPIPRGVGAAYVGEDTLFLVRVRPGG
ncbi:MAG: hypothetical protein OEZ65_03380 [Gemmatimonadota bacterium]|nr:hypothetical protein [Gemmatimonadota bacterium]